MKEFNSGHHQIQDLQRCGRPRTATSEENVEEVLDCVTGDRRKTVDQIAFQLQILHTTVHRILKRDLKLKKKSAKYIPRLLTDQHK